ncbi:site-specific integrase [Mesorhizobium sp. M0800]|uniref:tyrosine-type recombinase/integrase n=1 Tax=Mesorhizobium sp. M0800 TaxID=2957000 RepID=UPI00333B61E5
MAKTVRDAKLETRTARERLSSGETVHWRTLVPGKLHLGYRRRKPGMPGVWMARRYVGKTADTRSGYLKNSLGLADDYQDGDGKGVLSFADAQRAAHAAAAQATAPQVVASSVTVAEAVEDYIRFLRAERKTGEEAERRARVFILPELGSLKVVDLTLARLEAWRDRLAAAPARLRTRPGKEQRYRAAPATPDELRARRATVNRTVTILKAALNRVCRRHSDIDDRAWRLLEPFGMVDVSRPGHLSVAEAQRLINAAGAESGFRDLVKAALMTGCRYGELCRLTVADIGRGRLAVRESKSGKPRDVRLTEEGTAFFQALAAGRPGDQLVFRRADGEGWGKSHQARPMLAACVAAKIVPAVGFHQLRHTWASLAVMAGMPLMMVAENLGHADTRMVEKHYGHLTEDYRDEMIRSYAPRFGLTTETNVVSISEPQKGAS